MDKKQHFSCKNCKQLSCTRFKNKVIFCFGLIKHLKKPTDYYRFCISRGKKIHKTDIMLEELYAMLQGLSTILMHKKIEEVNKKKK